MEDDALALVGETLAKNDIKPEEFRSVIFALLQTRYPRRWRKRVERVYLRFDQPARQAARSAMLHLYVALDDAPEALLYLPEPRDIPDEDLFLAMDVYRELELRQAAAETAERCREALAGASDDCLKSTLVDALGSYCVWAGEWGEAIKVWAEVPVTSPFLREALCGIAELQAAQTVMALRFGLAHTTYVREQACGAMVPGEVEELERELTRMLRLAQKVIRPSVHERLGLDAKIAQFIVHLDGTDADDT